MVLDPIEKGEERTGELTKQREMKEKWKTTFILQFTAKVFTTEDITSLQTKPRNLYFGFFTEKERKLLCK